jgi:hypothetical protein
VPRKNWKKLSHFCNTEGTRVATGAELGHTVTPLGIEGLTVEFSF